MWVTASNLHLTQVFHLVWDPGYSILLEDGESPGSDTFFVMPSGESICAGSVSPSLSVF